MNLLVVHEVNYLSKIIYEFQILPEILSMEGHLITIVDYDDSWQEHPGGALIRLRTEVHQGVHRAYPAASVTVRRPGMIRMRVASRVSGAALAGVELGRLLRNSGFDAVLLYGVPTVGVQALVAAAVAHVPVFFRSIDVLHRLVPNPLLVYPTWVLEKIVYRHVRAVSCVTPNLRRYVIAHGVRPDRVSVTPSGVDTNLFSPGADTGPFRSEWDLAPEDRLVLFMGTIYTFSGLDRVISDWPLILDRHPRARLLIVGIGPDQPRLQELVLSRGLEGHVVFTGLQSYERLPEIIRSSDLCINPFELNDITRDILPTKLFQYLACAKPVLATRLPGTVPFLAGEEQGVVYESLLRFVDRLADLLDDPDLLIRLGSAGAQQVRLRYDWRGIARETASWIAERL